MTMALQEAVGLRRVEQSVDGGQLIGYWTGDVVFGWHYSGRSRPSLNKWT